MDAAEAAGDPDDRYEAAAATLPLGLPQWLSTRILLEETRPAHTPFDEVLDAWAREDFKAAVEEPARVATGLRLLLTARRWSTVVLQGLAWGADDPAVRGPVCTAARRLGLRADALAPGLDCSAVPDAPPVRVVRQSFEDPDADDLTFAGRMRTMRPTPMRRIQSDQHEVYGGHGRLLINTYDEELRDRALGAVVWGPLPWPGRRFGALVGGGKRSDETHVVVEGWKDGAWVTLARMTNGHEEESLIAQIADLGPVPLPWVRARVVDASTGGWGHIIADGLTFVDVDTAR
jgi:hypothetical protein